MVSAEEQIFSGEAKFVALPGESGELGILPNHTPLITRIKPGAVRIQYALTFEAPAPVTPRDAGVPTVNLVGVLRTAGTREPVSFATVRVGDRDTTSDEAGRFEAYKVVDPSFHNWSGLQMALRDQQISDFPLCNKSFNLSYCGHDL